MQKNYNSHLLHNEKLKLHTGLLESGKKMLHAD